LKHLLRLLATIIDGGSYRYSHSSKNSGEVGKEAKDADKIKATQPDD